MMLSVDKVVVGVSGPLLNPAAQVVNYIKGKCGMGQDQIEKKLVNGELFEMMKG